MLPLPTCDECGGPFKAEASQMVALCAECAHWLYGYPPCRHQMASGTCTVCGWTGTTTPYIDALKAEAAGNGDARRDRGCNEPERP